MPLGILTVAGIGRHPAEFVAWAWAVNGFASVIGSVLATIVAMTYGFGVLLVLGLAMYGVALVALRALTAPSRTAGGATGGGLEREGFARAGVGPARREGAQT